MSRQTLVTAALHAAYHLGIRQNVYKLESKVGLKGTELLAFMQPYIFKLSEFNDIASDMAMKEPDNLAEKLYGEFSKWLCNFIHGNDEMPKEEAINEAMMTITRSAYRNVLLSTQLDRLQERLMGAV